MAKSSDLLVFWHLGLGDAIACRAIIGHYSQHFRRIWIGSKPHNVSNLKGLFLDNDAVRVVRLASANPDRVQRRLQAIAKTFGVSTLGLGTFGENFLEPPYLWNFDENFFIQSGVSFSKRVEGTSFPRNLDLEQSLEKELALGNEGFYFVHEDPARGFLIDKERLPKNLRQVRSDSLGYRFPITAWIGIILRAKELHVIESSFAALIETINPPGLKVAHRYARAMVVKKPQMEWTYQTNWVIEK